MQDAGCRTLDAGRWGESNMMHVKSTRNMSEYIGPRPHRPLRAANNFPLLVGMSQVRAKRYYCRVAVALDYWLPLLASQTTQARISLAAQMEVTSRHGVRRDDQTGPGQYTVLSIKRRTRARTADRHRCQRCSEPHPFTSPTPLGGGGKACHSGMRSGSLLEQLVARPALAVLRGR